MDLEYDAMKRAANLRKHGIDLDDASPVLFDPRALVRDDLDAAGEQRSSRLAWMRCDNC